MEVRGSSIDRWPMRLFARGLRWTTLCLSILTLNLLLPFLADYDPQFTSCILAFTMFAMYFLCLPMSAWVAPYMVSFFWLVGSPIAASMGCKAFSHTFSTCPAESMHMEINEIALVAVARGGEAGPTVGLRRRPRGAAV